MCTKIFLAVFINILLACSGGSGVPNDQISGPSNPPGQEPKPQEDPKHKDDPKFKIKRKVDGPMDPFGLQYLLTNEYENLPRDIPRLTSIKVEQPLILEGLDDALLKKLEGTWISGSEMERFYLKFDLNRTWSGLKIRSQKTSSERLYALLSGTFVVVSGRLKLMAQKFEHGHDKDFSKEEIVYYFECDLVHDCPGEQTDALNLEINFEDKDALVLFMPMGDSRMSSRILVRKNN